MNRFLWTALATVPFWAFPYSAEAGGTLHHDLQVKLDPETHRLEVTDVLHLPPDLPLESDGTLTFVLHAGWTPELLLKDGRRSPLSPLPRGGQADADEGAPVPLERFALQSDLRGQEITLQYQGELFHPLDSEAAMQARGFQETPGLISPDGIYMSGSSVWIPTFGDGLLTFTLAVDLPAGYSALSQGQRVGSRADAGRSRSLWSSPEAQDQIYVVAATFTEYQRSAGKVDALALLRTPDPDLAERYLAATEQYLALYERLLGPYPYGKFALVENFWETGYGMPSFTLLGQKVIRLPFILTSSYPHEILHNWWGNGVYVDYERGNWCEGLTAYLSDFLFQEAQGKGLEYRQETLQKYTDYAAQGRDFPLSHFQERRSSATEAVGYGKSLMVWHMLRLQLGDERFLEGLRRFYQSYRFKVASFDDLQKTFETVSGTSLETFFTQWVEREGAPQLALSKVKVSGKAGAFKLTALLEQRQEGPVYTLSVPMVLTLEGQKEATVLLQNVERKTAIRWEGASKPLRLDVDPSFDIFRLLDRAEMPPALSALFGAPRVAVVLPAASSPELMSAYRAFFDALAPAHSGQVTVLTDAEAPDLSSYDAAWVVGWESAQLGWIKNAVAKQGLKLDAPQLSLPDVTLQRAGQILVMALDDPLIAGRTLGFLATDAPAALASLTMRLPHYHKYSYLAFSAADGKNTAKGRWPVVGSPLTYTGGAEESGIPKGSLPPRIPLSGPGPVPGLPPSPSKGGPR